MMAFSIGDKVYLQLGLERTDPREFTVLETAREEGIDLVRVDHPQADGWWEEKFFGLTPTADAGIDLGKPDAKKGPDPVQLSVSERRVARIEELVAAASAAVLVDDKAAAQDALGTVAALLRDTRDANGARTRP
jgi:hypothetical protein